MSVVCRLGCHQRETAAGRGEFRVRCSFLEIHNEEIKDLLDSDADSAAGHGSGGSGARKDGQEKLIAIRETPRGEIMVLGVEEPDVTSYEELMGSVIWVFSLCCEAKFMSGVWYESDAWKTAHCVAPRASPV